MPAIESYFRRAWEAMKLFRAWMFPVSPAVAKAIRDHKEQTGRLR